NKYNELLELIYSSLQPLTSDENKSLWGLSMPLLPKIFYGTNGLYELIIDKRTGKLRSDAISPMNDKTMFKQRIEMAYSFLLERLYSIPSFVRYEIIHCFIDEKTHLHKYYKLNIDPRFIEVEVKGELPKLNFETLQPHLNDNTALEFLKDLLP